MSPQTDGIEHGPLKTGSGNGLPNSNLPRLREDPRRHVEPHLSGHHDRRVEVGSPPSPLGKVLGPAHDMGREARGRQGAGRNRGAGCRRVVGYCEDEAVTGAPFT